MRNMNLSVTVIASVLAGILFGGCTPFFDTSLPACLRNETSCVQGTTDDDDVIMSDTGGDTGIDVMDPTDGGGDTTPDADVTDAVDGGGDTTPDADVTDAVDGGGDTTPDAEAGTQPFICGDGICSADEVCVRDCGDPEAFGTYVANFHPEDIADVYNGNPRSTPYIEVNIPGIGWQQVAEAGEPFRANQELQWARWRISIPFMPGENACEAHMVLPECRGANRTCLVELPPLVPRDMDNLRFTDEGGQSWRVETSLLCIDDVADLLPVTPEIFCPTTRTVIWKTPPGDDSESIGDLLCIEPTYLVNRENVILTQCFDQRSGEHFMENCGFFGESYPLEFPDWVFEQTLQATGRTTQYGVKR